MNWGGSQVERVRFFALYRSVALSVVRLLAALILGLSVLILGLSLFDVVPSTLLGFALIFAGPTVAIVSFHLYATSLWLDPPAARNKSRYPLDRFDYPSVQALLVYRKTGNRADFWSQLLTVPAIETALLRLGLSFQYLETIYQHADQGAEMLLSQAVERYPNDTQIDAFELLAVAITEPHLKDYLTKAKHSSESVAALIDFYAWHYRHNREHRFWHSWQQRGGGFAKFWATSYTNFLDRFTWEPGATLVSRRRAIPLIGRTEVVEQLIIELNKQEGQNVLLVGEPGVGRTEVFYDLAARIVSYETKTRLDGSQVRVLDVTALLTAAPTPADQAQLFEALFADIARAGNVVLFIPRIDLLLSGQGPGSAEAGTLLSQYLGNQRVHIVGSITPESQVTLVRAQPALAEQFSLLTVPAPTELELQRILFFNLPLIEYRYRVFFLLSSLQSVIKLAGRYLKNETPPAREIRLLEEVAAHGQKDGSVITAAEVEAVIERRANVQLQVDENERETLLSLEADLHRRVVGQDRAIKLVSDALLRARAGLTQGTKPIGTFLFLGPTGVGKTETAKALAEIYFGSATNLIRLDMSEYADQNGLEKLLGRDPGREPGSLTVAIQKSPSAVVLFDEIEKASDAVRNLMLQLLDEGRLTTNYGKVLDFTNSIIIATSNAGSDFIKAQVEKHTAPAVLEKQLIDQLIDQRIYAPEYLNRFDGVVVYLPLTRAEIKQVVQLQLTALTRLIKREKGVELLVSDDVLSELAQKGYDPVFGARALQRVIKDRLETAIARQLIAEKPEPGSRLVINSL